MGLFVFRIRCGPYVRRKCSMASFSIMAPKSASGNATLDILEKLQPFTVGDERCSSSRIMRICSSVSIRQRSHCVSLAVRAGYHQWCVISDPPVRRMDPPPDLVRHRVASGGGGGGMCGTTWDISCGVGVIPVAISTALRSQRRKIACWSNY